MKFTCRGGKKELKHLDRTSMREQKHTQTCIHYVRFWQSSMCAVDANYFFDTTLGKRAVFNNAFLHSALARFLPLALYR